MTSKPSPLLLPAALLLAGCPNDHIIEGVNDLPTASLSANETEFTKGVAVTFEGKIEDADHDNEDLSAAWTFKDKSGGPLDLGPQPDCLQGPVDIDNKQGVVYCTITTPTDIDEMWVYLAGSDPQGTGDDASLRVTLDSGGVPTCAISAPDPDPVDPYSADQDIGFDGTCSDAGGETEAADLELWFEDTYRNDEGQTISQEYRAEGDTGDTGGAIMSFETSGNEARLYGFVFLPAATHNLCLFARDESGNKNGVDTCVSFEVEVPNTPPWCQIVLPADGSTGGIGDTVHLAAQVGDADQEASTLYIEWRSNQEEDPIGYGTPDSDGWVSIDETGAFGEPETHEITLYVEDDEGEPCTATVEYTVGSGPYVEIISPDPLTDADERTFGLTEIITFEANYHDTETECEGLLVEWGYEGDDGEKAFTGWDTDGDASCTSIQFYDPATDSDLSEEGSYVIRVKVTDDEGYSQTASTYLTIADCSQDWYLDLDGDGYGTDEDVVSDCSPPTGYSAIPGDCDDSNAAINPGVASESCNGLDDNCNGDVDEGFHTIALYQDADGDGYGDTSTPYDIDGDGTPDDVCSKTTLPGWSALPGDCDDSQADVNPAEDEQCDDIDHDCDGDIDNGFTYPYGTVLYQDADGDGYGASPLATCEARSGYVTTDGDCDDSDTNVNPDEPEICNGIDDDCDGTIDPAGLDTCVDRYLDADGDGYGTSAGTSACVCPAYPGLYSSTNTGDCDDSDFSINPDATEICDDHDADENCDGYSDLEGSTGCEDLYYDADGDDYYAAGALSRCLCDPDGDYGAHLSGDCNDGDPAINPGAAEVCDSLNTDEDCDGLVNDADGSVSGGSTWYQDADSDSYGNPAASVSRCAQPSGYVANDDDCNDGDDAINPDASEICDPSNVDEDCDGSADDADSYASGKSTWYRDADGDTYGWAATTTAACDQPSGYVSNSADCNDGSASISPDATEVCDSRNTDEDCDGVADDADSWASGKSTWYRDADGDGYGDPSNTTAACDQPSGYLGNDDDCLDSNEFAFPGAAEHESSTSCRKDDDGDGYGDDSPPSGVTAGSDCNDTFDWAYPGAVYTDTPPTISTGNPTVLDSGDENLGTGGVDFHWDLSFSFASGNGSITREMEARWDARSSTDATVFRHVSSQTAIDAPAGCTIHSVQNHRGDVAYSPSGVLTSTYDHSVTSNPGSFPHYHTKSSSSTTPHVESVDVYLLKDWGDGHEYCSSDDCAHLHEVVFFPMTITLD